jgi:hypothetical protein
LPPPLSRRVGRQEADMTPSNDLSNSNDPYNLTRFVRAQQNDYAQAL